MVDIEHRPCERCGRQDEETTPAPEGKGLLLCDDCLAIDDQDHLIPERAAVADNSLTAPLDPKEGAHR
jgi:NMD protein affecting ribosome stability and mRNA decay